jgi:hypothetical protein
MIMRTRNHPVILIVAAFFIFAAPAAGRAENLFRLYPELQVNGFYADNLQLKTSNGEGDFGGTMVGGFYLDYTSAARYASLHYDTFAQLFAHFSRFDRAGEGQFVNATDDENLSPTTKLRFYELFYRDATAAIGITTSDQAPQFNSVLALILLANQQASINQFVVDLSHDWSRRWSSEFTVHQETFWSSGSNSGQSNTSYYQGASAITDYHFSAPLSLGLGYRYYDFRFSVAGRPGQQDHWPLAHIGWYLTKDLYFNGIVGPVISHTQGTSSDQVSPAGIGMFQYRFERGYASLYGGQEPELTSFSGTVGFFRGVRGSVSYQLTPRLTGTAGGAFYNLSGSGLDGNFVSWGVGLSQRVNRWLSLNTRFIEIRSQENGSSQFLSSGTQSGEWAVGNYYIVGLAVSIEAFRWSWQ